LKVIKDSIENFFKWVSSSELVELTDIDCSEDPVRPDLDLEFRTSFGRKIFGLKANDEIQGIICVAYCNDIPQSERELNLISQNASLLDNAHIAVAYTVWSRKKGAGREIVDKLKKYYKNRDDIKRLVTLSPLTPMATHFHISNGARLVQHNSLTQNFEYIQDKG